MVRAFSRPSYTPEDLLQMSWHVSERVDAPLVFRAAAAAHNFPAQVSLSFLLGGVQVLALPCNLRRRTASAGAAPPLTTFASRPEAGAAAAAKVTLRSSAVVFEHMNISMPPIHVDH